MIADDKSLNPISLSTDSLEFVEVLSCISDSVFFLDASYQFTYVNSAFVELIGLTAQDLLQKRLSELIHPDDREKFLLTLQYSRSQLLAVSVQTKLVTSERDYVSLRIILRPRVRHRQFDGFMAVAQKIAISSSASEEMEGPKSILPKNEKGGAFFDSAKKVGEILERVTDGFFAVDREWRVIYMNHLAERIAMRSKEEVLGKSMWEVAPEYIGTNIYRKYHESMESGMPLQFVEYMPHFDAWIETKLFPSEDGLTCYFIDVTEKKKIEQRMQETVDRLMLALQGSNTGIWDWNIKTGESYSKGWKALLGYSDSELDNSIDQWLRLTHPDDRGEAKKAFDSYLQGLAPNFELQHRLLHRDGEYRWLLSRGVSFPNDKGELHRMVGISVDITRQKIAEEKLQKLTEDFARSNLELEQFAAVAAHDLKEPLRMVSIYLQLLSTQYKGKLDHEADEYIQEAVSAVQRLSLLIDALLVYSQAGKEDKPLESIALAQPIHLAIQNITASMKEANAQIHFEDLPIIQGDLLQLTQLFQNLFSNSIKFRSEGRAPEIRVKAQKQDDDTYLIQVKDNGIGMKQIHLGRIFKIFQRLHNRDQYPGTGIGLAVAKKIIERHGGRIWVESELGQGTTFFFTLRMAP